MRIVRDFLGRALRDELAALLAALRADVEQVVRALHEVEVVLDDEDGVAVIDEAVQDLYEFPHVLVVEADGRFVEEVDGPLKAGTEELARDLHALRLAARERRRRLAELEVAEPHFRERTEAVRDAGDVAEEFETFLDRHLEDLVDILFLVPDLERVLGVTLAETDVARHVDRREEVHLDRDLAVPLAGLAAAAGPVEREAPRLPPPYARLARLGKELTDERERAGIRDRVRTGRPPDR